MLNHLIRNGRDVPQNIYMGDPADPHGGKQGDLVVGQLGCHHDGGQFARDVVEATNRDTQRRMDRVPMFQDPIQNGTDLRDFAAKLTAASNWDTDNGDDTPDFDDLLATAAEKIEKLSWLIGPDGVPL